MRQYLIHMKVYIRKLDAKDIHKLARVREKKSRDLGNIRCIKSVDNKLLLEKMRLKKCGRITFINYIMKSS